LKVRDFWKVLFGATIPTFCISLNSALRGQDTQACYTSNWFFLRLKSTMNAWNGCLGYNKWIEEGQIEPQFVI